MSDLSITYFFFVGLDLLHFISSYEYETRSFLSVVSLTSLANIYFFLSENDISFFESDFSFFIIYNFLKSSFETNLHFK